MTRPSRRYALPLLAALSLAAVVVPAPAQTRKPRPNVLLITMEATRPDHLGIYEDKRAATPALDQLAHEGAVFEQVLATAPLTLPSHASILTGQYPPRHGVRDNAGSMLEGARGTLAQYLKGQGYATAATVGNALLAGAAGLKRGFDGFQAPKHGSRGAQEVVDEAIAAISRMKGGPFFLWVQLDDAQAPYAPPAPYATRFQDRPYDGEIAFMDAQIKRLVDHLRTETLIDGTIIIATGAEGESLGEHGEEGHGLLAYDATLKVPLVIRYAPKVPAATIVKEAVSHVDLVPTILDLVGLPQLPGTQGRTFLPTMQGIPQGDRDPIYAEALYGEKTFGWAPLHVWRTTRRKFIDAPKPEVYDTRRDPSETINLLETDPTTQVSAFMPNLIELRKAVGDTVVEAEAGAKPRKDPKTLVKVGNLYVQARAAIEAGKPEEAVPLLNRAIARDPDNAAVKSLLSALRGEPVQPKGPEANSFAAQWNLGNALYAQGKLDESEKAFRRALTLNPASAETHFALGNVLAAKGDPAGAEAELRAAVTADPRMADGWNKLGILLEKSKRRPEALDAYSRALAAAPGFADALFNRAKIEILDQQLADARRDLDELLKTHPDYAAGVFLDAHLCTAEKNPDGAKAALKKFLAMPNIDPGMKKAAEEMLRKSES